MGLGATRGYGSLSAAFLAMSVISASSTAGKPATVTADSRLPFRIRTRPSTMVKPSDLISSRTEYVSSPYSP